jgi:TPR repeat protein
MFGLDMDDFKYDLRKILKQNDEAKFCLSSMFLIGVDVERNFEKAFSMQNDLVEKGYAPAMCFMAAAYLSDMVTCDNPNERAFALLTKASAMGFKVAAEMVDNFKETENMFKKNNKNFLLYLHKIITAVANK